MFTHPQKRLIFLSSLGGILEFYDFVIYALMAGYIAKQFFPAENNTVSLITTFATFSVGYLVRPIGGIIFGHFGDRIGRKKTFSISILMMALATLFIGLIPSYHTIGITAPLILTLLRICQGLSVGGEIPGAIVYVSESIPEKKGFACGLIFCSIISGLVFGSLVQAFMTSFLSEQQMLQWGFRIPFLIGGILGLLSYTLRRELKESPIFKALETSKETLPVLKVFQKEFRNTLAATFIVALGASLMTSLFLFAPAYINNILHFSSSTYIWYSTVTIACAAILNIIFGALSDKVNVKNLIFYLSIMTLLFAYPIFFIYSNFFSLFVISLFLSALLIGLAFGAIPSLVSELFPVNIRYSGIAVCYNLGFAFFGGLTPIISSVLIYKTNLVIAPAFYLMLTACLAIAALMFTQKSVKSSLSSI